MSDFVAGATLCEPRSTVAGPSGAMVGHARNRPSMVVRVFACFLKCRFRGRRSTLSTSMCQSADFVAGAALCEPPSADVVAGTALCEPRCADCVAGAVLCEPPCADFVAGTALCEPPCFSEPRRGSSAERRLRDDLAPWSVTLGIVPPLWLEFSLVS